MADELFELKNYFYLGNLSAALQEGETVRPDDQKSEIELSLIMKRIHLQQGAYDSVTSSITDDDPPALQLVKNLAQLLKDPDSTTIRDEVSASTLALFQDEVAMSSACSLKMCAILFAHLGDLDNALRAAHRSRGLEGRAIAVATLLRMDRADMAEKEVLRMQNEDEDATLTQLANAWTHMGKGGSEGMQEALYVFQDLLERHGATDQILNGMAVCHVGLGKSDESERVLKEALTKNPKCATSLVNVICSSQSRHKPAELVKRYFEQLKSVAPRHEWLVDYRRKETEFDQVAAQLEATATTA